MTDVNQRAADLTTAAAEGSCDGVMKQLHDATEADRAVLRKAALAGLRERLDACVAAIDAPTGLEIHDDEGPAPFAPATEEPEPAQVSVSLNERMREHIAGMKRERSRARALQLAIIGIGARKEVESALFAIRSGTQLEDDAGYWLLALKVLATRKTEWQGPVVIRALEGKPSRWTDYRIIQARLKGGIGIVRDGALPEDLLVPLLGRLVRQCGTFDFKSELGLKVAWSAVEARDEPFIGSSLYDPAQVVDELGSVDRPRLIALGLERLGRQSRGVQVNWWAQLVEALKLTSAEWALHRETALDLVNAATPRAIGLGVAGVKTLLKDGAASPAELVPVLAGAVQVETLGTARNVVQLLRTAARQDASVREDALLAALGGLMHPKSGVQDAVLEWLEAEDDWREVPPVQLLLADLVENLAGPAALRLARLLPPAEEPDTSSPHPGSPAASGSGELEARLAARIAAEPDPQARAWLESCATALRGSGPVPDARVDVRKLWRQDTPLNYPASAEETARLILTIAAHRGTDPPTLARLQAGVSQPVPAAARAHIRRLLDPVWKEQLFGRFARVWLGEPEEDDLHWFAATGTRLDRMPLQLPTHTEGWLDPSVFAQRALAERQLDVELSPELAAALYRLPADPEARAAGWELLAPSRKLSGTEAGSALRLALGPEQPNARAWEERLAACGGDWRRILLVAAARRCRNPEEDGAWLSSILDRLSSHTERLMFQDEALTSKYGMPLSESAFNWPAGVQSLLELVLSRGPQQWADSLVGALRAAARPDIQLRYLLPRLVEFAAHENPRVRGAVVELVAAAIRDGRLYTQDLLALLAPALVRAECRPRMQLAVLARLAEAGGTLQAGAACCLEQGLAGGVDGISGADRTALLEALLGWHSAAGRAVENPEARSVVERLAAERKKKRSVEVAKQLLLLPAGTGITPLRLMCLAHDVSRALERSGVDVAGQSQSE